MNRFKRFLLLLPITAAIILEALPLGAILRQAADPADGVKIERYSYFSLIPYGYANFSPMLTAIASSALLVLLIIYCISSKCLKTAIPLSIAATILSALPIVFDLYNAASMIITLLLAIESSMLL